MQHPDWDLLYVWSREYVWHASAAAKSLSCGVVFVFEAATDPRRSAGRSPPVVGVEGGGGRSHTSIGLIRQCHAAAPCGLNGPLGAHAVSRARRLRKLPIPGEAQTGPRRSWESRGVVGKLTQASAWSANASRAAPRRVTPNSTTCPLGISDDGKETLWHTVCPHSSEAIGQTAWSNWSKS